MSGRNQRPLCRRKQAARVLAFRLENPLAIGKPDLTRNDFAARAVIGKSNFAAANSDLRVKPADKINRQSAPSVKFDRVAVRKILNTFLPVKIRIRLRGHTKITHNPRSWRADHGVVKSNARPAVCWRRCRWWRSTGALTESAASTAAPPEEP